MRKERIRNEKNQQKLAENQLWKLAAKADPRNDGRGKRATGHNVLDETNLV